MSLWLWQRQHTDSGTGSGTAGASPGSGGGGSGGSGGNNSPPNSRRNIRRFYNTANSTRVSPPRSPPHTPAPPRYRHPHRDIQINNSDITEPISPASHEWVPAPGFLESTERRRQRTWLVNQLHMIDRTEEIPRLRELGLLDSPASPAPQLQAVDDIDQAQLQLQTPRNIHRSFSVGHGHPHRRRLSFANVRNRIRHRQTPETPTRQQSRARSQNRLENMLTDREEPPPAYQPIAPRGTRTLGIRDAVDTPCPTYRSYGQIRGPSHENTHAQGPPPYQHPRNGNHTQETWRSNPRILRHHPPADSSSPRTLATGSSRPQDRATGADPRPIEATRDNPTTTIRGNISSVSQAITHPTIPDSNQVTQTFRSANSNMARQPQNQVPHQLCVKPDAELIGMRDPYNRFNRPWYDDRYPTALNAENLALGISSTDQNESQSIPVQSIPLTDRQVHNVREMGQTDRGQADNIDINVKEYVDMATSPIRPLVPMTSTATSPILVRHPTSFPETPPPRRTSAFQPMQELPAGYPFHSSAFGNARRGNMQSLTTHENNQLSAIHEQVKKGVDSSHRQPDTLGAPGKSAEIGDANEGLNPSRAMNVAANTNLLCRTKIPTVALELKVLSPPDTRNAHSATVPNPPNNSGFTADDPFATPPHQAIIHPPPVSGVGVLMATPNDPASSIVPSIASSLTCGDEETPPSTKSVPQSAKSKMRDRANKRYSRMSHPGSPRKRKARQNLALRLQKLVTKGFTGKNTGKGIPHINDGQRRSNDSTSLHQSPQKPKKPVLVVSNSTKTTVGGDLGSGGSLPITANSPTPQVRRIPIMRSMVNLSSSISRGTKNLFKHVNENSLPALAPGQTRTVGGQTQRRQLKISAPILSPLSGEQQRQADALRTQMFAALGDVGSRASERYAGSVPGRCLGDGAVVVDLVERTANVKSNCEVSQNISDNPVPNNARKSSRKGKAPETKDDGSIYAIHNTKQVNHSGTQAVNQGTLPHDPLVPEVRDDYEVGDDPNESVDGAQPHQTTLTKSQGEGARMSAVWHTPWVEGFERVIGPSPRYGTVTVITANHTEAKAKDSGDELLGHDSDNSPPLTSEQMGGIRVDVVMETTWEPNLDFITNNSTGNSQVEGLQEVQGLPETRTDSIAEINRVSTTGTLGQLGENATSSYAGGAASKLVGTQYTRDFSPITPRRAGAHPGNIVTRGNMSPTQNMYAQSDPYGFERSYEARHGRKVSINAETVTPAAKVSSAFKDKNINKDLPTDVWSPVEPPMSLEPEIPRTRFGFSLSSPRRPQLSQQLRSSPAMRRTSSTGRPSMAAFLRLGRSETVSRRQPKLSPLKSTQRDFKHRTRPNTRTHHPVSFHGTQQILDSLQRVEPEEGMDPKIVVSAQMAGGPKAKMINGGSGNMSGDTLRSTQELPLVPISNMDVVIADRDTCTAISGSGNVHTLGEGGVHTDISSFAGTGRITNLKFQKERNWHDENERPSYPPETFRGGTKGKSMHSMDTQIESPSDPFTDIQARVCKNTNSVISINQLDKSAGDRIAPLKTITPPEQQLHPITRGTRQRPITSVVETSFSQSSTPGLPIFPAGGRDAGNLGRNQFYATKLHQPSNTNLSDHRSQQSGVRDDQNRGVGQDILHELEVLSQGFHLTESSRLGALPTQNGASVGTRPGVDNIETGHNLQARPNRRLFFPTLTVQPEDGTAPATVQGGNAPPGSQSSKPKDASGSSSESGLGEGPDISNKFSHLRI